MTSRTAQLYSTQSYQAKNLSGIRLRDNDFTGWDFSGQNLTNADLVRLHAHQREPDGSGRHGDQLLRHHIAWLHGSPALLDPELSSEEPQRNWLGGNDLTGWDFREQNLTNAASWSSTLTNANLTGAVVTGADFYDTTWRGFTAAQLYSTQSYQAKDLSGIGLWDNDLTGWDFRGQNLTNANLEFSTLTGANLTGAVVTGTNFGGPHRVASRRPSSTRPRAIKRRTSAELYLEIMTSPAGTSAGRTSPTPALSRFPRSRTRT